MTPEEIFKFVAETRKSCESIPGINEPPFVEMAATALPKALDIIEELQRLVRVRGKGCQCSDEEACEFVRENEGFYRGKITCLEKELAELRKIKEVLQKEVCEWRGGRMMDRAESGSLGGKRRAELVKLRAIKAAAEGWLEKVLGDVVTGYPRSHVDVVEEILAGRGPK